MAHMIFGPRRIEMTEQNFLTYWWKKKLWCCEGNKVDPKLFQRLYLGQTLINRHKPWCASSTPWTEDIFQSWEQRHLWVLRYKKCTILHINFESTVKFSCFCIVSFQGICRFWRCLICHFPNMCLSAIWSKLKTVFSLLLLQTLFNFIQNLIIWSLDRPAQKWLNRFLIFATVPEKYLSKLTVPVFLVLC